MHICLSIFEKIVSFQRGFFHNEIRYCSRNIIGKDSKYAEKPIEPMNPSKINILLSPPLCPDGERMLLRCNKVTRARIQEKRWAATRQREKRDERERGAEGAMDEREDYAGVDRRRRSTYFLPGPREIYYRVGTFPNSANLSRNISLHPLKSRLSEMINTADVWTCAISSGFWTFSDTLRDKPTGKRVLLAKSNMFAQRKMVFVLKLRKIELVKTYISRLICRNLFSSLGVEFEEAFFLSGTKMPLFKPDADQTNKWITYFNECERCQE